MNLVDESIISYIQGHLPEPLPVFKEIDEFTKKNTYAPQMLSGFYQASLLAFLAKLTPCKTIVEIGTFTGYTSLFLAKYTNASKIITFESDPKHVEISRNFFNKIPEGKKIEIVSGPALENLKKFVNESFDFVFIDADKQNYDHYFDCVKWQLSPQGLIVADNVLWSGAVLDPNNKEQSTKSLKAYNLARSKDQKFETIILPVRDGLSVTRILVGKN